MDLIFVSLENWDEIWRRNQFVCARLARRYPENRFLFVAPARDVTNQLRRGKFGALTAAGSSQVPGIPNLLVTRPLKLLPNSIAAGRRFNEWLARCHVRRVVAEWGVRNPVLWLNPHSAVHMAGQMNESSVIYDITDDWTQLSQSTAERELTIEQDAALCRQADAVIVCSERLQELKRSLARELHLIPNGVETEHYDRVMDGDGALPQECAAWARPVLGYTGSIHGDRVDLELVESLAVHFSQGTIALVGPIMLEARQIERLRTHRNIVLTGPVAYDRIPDYMRAFDVAMTPHRVTPFTESLNPIKLWEYLAAGKPIVATNVAGFRDFPELVHVAGDAAEFCRAAELALQEEPSRSAARRAEARRHTWEERVDQIERVLQRAGRKSDQAVMSGVDVRTQLVN